MGRFFLMGGAISGFLSVALGAFAAHALKSTLDEYRMGVFRTGVDYQFLHALALALVGLLALRVESGWARASGLSFLAGSVVFSGSLYLLAATGTRWWGAVTPVGGVALLVGWLCLAVAASRL